MNGEFTEIIEASRPSVTVIGLGGAGSNIITFLSEKNIAGAKIIAANSEISHLILQTANKLLLL